MNMPVRRFWVLNSSIDRINAQEDVRYTTNAIVAAASDGNAYKSHISDLREKIGRVMTVMTQPEFDRAGYERLKALANFK